MIFLLSLLLSLSHGGIVERLSHDTIDNFIFTRPHSVVIFDDSIDEQLFANAKIYIAFAKFDGDLSVQFDIEQAPQA